MTLTREQIEALLDGVTKGPWNWAVNKRSQAVELEGRNGDLTVMSFVRWGMNRAAPMFWFWKGNVSDEPKRAEAVAVPVVGREHHKDWFMTIDHPDANLIAATPDLAATALAALDRVAELLDVLDSIDVYLSDTLSGRTEPDPATYQDWLIQGIRVARDRARTKTWHQEHGT